MSQKETEQETEPYLPPRGPPPQEGRGYDGVRGYLRSRPDRFRTYQRRMNRARMGTTYDLYLTRTVIYAAAAGTVGLLVGAVVGFAAVSFGVDIGVTAVAVVASTVVPAAAVATYRYHLPRYVAERRRHEIDVSLPSAVLFMHALSKGGMGPIEVMEKLSASESVYGEAAVEFGNVLREMRMFNDELLKALENAKGQTPSRNFEIFLDDMASVIESGGDLQDFFETESRKQIRQMREENESLLETLDVLAETYIILVFAGPIFLIVVLIALSFAGASTLLHTQAVAYVVIPLGVILSYVALDLMGKSLEWGDETLEVGDGPGSPPDDERTEGYVSSRRWTRLKRKLTSPLEVMEESPRASLVITVPLAFVFVGLLASRGIVTPTPTGYAEDPIGTTTWLFGAPFLIPSLVLMTLHEMKMDHREDINRRFPEMLEAVGGANANGVRLANCFEMVARRTGGRLAYHLRRLHNDVQWNGDIERSLLVTANEIRIPRVSRAMKLVAEGSKSTGRLSSVLDAVAEEMDSRYRIDEKRKRAMETHVIVLFMGVLVYLFIAVVFSRFFFAEIAQTGELDLPVVEAGVLPEDVPIDGFRTVLYHSALIQAVGNSLIMGKLVDNRAASGLKYANVLVVIVMAVFVAL